MCVFVKLGYDGTANAILLQFFLRWIAQIIYNIFFHPLRRFPGPKLWAASDLPSYYYEYRGIIDFKIRELHEKYGETIRVMPNKVSFTNSAAYKDIYGYGKNQLIKDQLMQGPVSKGLKDLGIIQADNASHARIRRQLAHAFSEKALREQEPLIQGYVDTIIAHLSDTAELGDKIDIMHQYMYTTSDITSELAFGTSFNSLNEDKLREFVHLQDSTGSFLVAARMIARFPLLAPVIAMRVGTSLVNSLKTNRQWVTDVVAKRLSQGVMEEKKDFLSYVLKHKDEDAAMTDGEIRETSRTLILAGAETTRTVLSGVTYYLLRNPEMMRRAQDEVRNAFQSEDEIKFTAASQRLPYMLACLDEAMRMHPPLPSIIMTRETPVNAPMAVMGEVVPANSKVMVHPYSTLTSSRNFQRPLEFHPERWLATKGDDTEFANDDRSASQPFSYGPRNCIGRNLAYSKMRIILARVLWNFDLALCPESEDWEDQKIKFLWLGKSLWVRVKQRDVSKA